MFIKSIFDKILFAPDKEGGTGDDDKTPSVADSVLAAFTEHEKTSDSTAGAPAGTAAASKEKDSSAAGTTSAGTPDKKGAPAASSAADTKNPTNSQGEGKDKQGGTPADTVEAPASWDAASKAEFAKLPPDVQKYIAKREGERDGFVKQKGEELTNYRKRFDTIDQILEPRRQHFQRMGMSEAQVVGQLLALADQADRDFVGFIKEQAKLRNFDLKQLFPADGDKQNFIDPVVKQLQDELADLKNRENQRVTHAANQTTQTLVQQIETFRDEKDNGGNPLRPHYAKLEADMEPFIIAIRRGNPNLPAKEVLQQAYDRALWSNPELRGDLIEQERKAAADKLVNEERERAEKAKGAAVTHRGSPTGGTGSTASKDETVEETLRATMAAQGW